VIRGTKGNTSGKGVSHWERGIEEDADSEQSPGGDLNLGCAGGLANTYLRENPANQLKTHTGKDQTVQKVGP